MGLILKLAKLLNEQVKGTDQSKLKKLIPPLKDVPDEVWIDTISSDSEEHPEDESLESIKK